MCLGAALSPSLSAESSDSGLFALPLQELLQMRLTAEVRKRPENIQTVPVSVTTLTGQVVESRQIEAVSDLGAHTPSLTTSFSSGYAANPRIFLRGLGQNETTMPTAESAVGLYLDDVYLARIIGSNLPLTDVERVEVLRGPQGALYGRNTTTGAIKIVSNRPDDRRSLRLSARFGSHERREYELVANAPLGGQGLKARAALLLSDREGYMDRYAEPGVRSESDIGDRRHFGGRVALRYEPRDDASFDLQLYRHQDEGDALYTTPVSGDRRPLTGADLYSTLTASQQYSDVEQTGLSFTASWRNGLGQWKAVTGVRDLGDRQFNDISGQDDWTIDGEIDTRQLSQELQLSRFDDAARLGWVVGAFLLWEDNRARVFNSLDGGNLTSEQSYDLRNRSAALYGALNYALAAQTELAVGGRYTNDDKDFEGRTSNTGGVFSDGSADLQRAFSNFSPMLSLSHQLGPDALLYATVARGFKAGGFQGRAFNGEDLNEVFGPEIVTSYELGYKANYLDRRLRLAASYYHNDFRDLQLNTLNEESGGTIIQNAGQARLHGFEFEADFITRFGLNAFFHWASAWGRYKSLDPNISNVTLDSELPETPKVSGMLGLDYERPLRDSAVLAAGVNYAFRSEAHPGAANSDVTEIPEVGIVNARVAYRFPGARWSLSVSAANLTDEAYHYTGFAFSSFQSLYAAPPRTLLFAINCEI